MDEIHKTHQHRQELSSSLLGRNESAKPTVLIIDEEESFVNQIRWAVESDYEVLTTSKEEEARQIFADNKPPVVTLELSLNKDNPDELAGLRLLEQFLNQAPSTRLIVITGNKEESSALEAVRLGAFDYYTKPVRLDEIKVMIHRAFHMQHLQKRLQESFQYSADGLKANDLGFARSVPADINLKIAKKAIEADFIKKALSRNNGIVSRAAKDLGISRVNLYELIDRYNIQIQDFKVTRFIETQPIKGTGGILS
jgi:DNA-binding NtrC family response regulator